MSEHRVRRGAVELFYKRCGSGPLVVLVPGLGLSCELWGGLPFGLARSGLCVVTPDNRRVGRSVAPEAPYDVAELADDLAAVIDDVGCGSAVVLGVSLGGMIGQHLALRRPRLVKGLALVSTSCGLPVGRASAPKALATLARGLCDPRAERSLMHVLTRTESQTDRVSPVQRWLRSLAQDTGERPSRSAIAAQLAAAASHNVGEALQHIACPAAVITGDDDQVIPFENSTILADRLPNATLTIVPGVGHAVALERPRILPEAIRRLI